MFDVFYTGPVKPNLFPHEQPAFNLINAAAKSRTKFFWLINGECDYSLFNFNWIPPKWEEHQTHVILLQSQFEQFQATFAPKDNNTLVEHYYDRTFLPRRAKKDNWKILKDEAKWHIDPKWSPNPFDPPYIYVFGNPWYSSIEMPTVEYHVPGATEHKYSEEQIVSVKADKKNWKILKNKEFNWHINPKWAPNPFEPPYIYCFSNKWFSADEVVAEYTVPGATERKYCDDETAIAIISDRSNWFVPEEVNEELIDFSWAPNPFDPPYIYHFGSEFQVSSGLTYTVPGATDKKFVDEIPLLSLLGSQDESIIQTVSMFFVDMNNKTSAARYEALKERYPDIQKMRFINGWIETIKRCLARSQTQKFWVISSENVYDDFNFEWHAEPWQKHMTHVFGSQWQKWSDTFLINKNEFQRHAKWAKSLEELPNLNFVKDQPVYRPDDLYDIYYVDHFNPGSRENLERIRKRYPEIKTARYVDNYLSTIKRVITTAGTEYVWITNSICDYSKFDFTWQPEPWQAKMLHVFPSNKQKFGDTFFYIHVLSFKEQMEDLELLDWYEVVNYCTEQEVPRLPIDVTTVADDTMIDAVKTHHFTGPYALFKTPNVELPKDLLTPNIWRKKDRAIHVLSKGGQAILVPRDAQVEITDQLYDYPYIVEHNESYLPGKDLDIVYISNGEPDADKWYFHLLNAAPNQRVHWVQDVKGRANAYKAAARASTTPWFFAVFAKLEVNPEFDWTWQPDRLQQQKHYIFNALNPVNGLEYGHMAVLAYNVNLVLETDEYGLDFTLSKRHEVVNMLSATAHFNVDPLITWRTAFRECIKLRDATDSDSKERLKIWCTVANGENADWCLRGANDAIEYYESVNGKMDKLMLSFEWEWLNSYFNNLYSIL
jgi:hypothetical protein